MHFAKHAVTNGFYPCFILVLDAFRNQLSMHTMLLAQNVQLNKECVQNVWKTKRLWNREFSFSIFLFYAFIDNTKTTSG